MDPWIAEQAELIARPAARRLEALVAVSSPSGDVPAAERCFAVCSALLPPQVDVERPACSSPDHAPDLVARLQGTGTARILLLGHIDTVVRHDAHRPLVREDDRLVGSGAVDMKGGVVLALGVLRALAERSDRFAEVALLLVCDEEWRTSAFAHTPAFAGWDACLCFEAGELTPEGEEGVVVRRKAAGTLRVVAEGRSAHSGSAPDAGRNALLALASVAQAVASCHDPSGPDRLTSVPTVVQSGTAFNVVPGGGELWADLRADDERAFDRVRDAIGAEHDGVRLVQDMQRVWPGMDAREETAAMLGAASELLGRPVRGTQRGGASDASHFAPTIPLTVDGLGPRGGAAHNPEEYVLEDSLRPRAEVALAVALAALGG